ncbi:TetR/AcrR family transcriptional regulator [Rhodococcus sp. KBS0724]|uniref:TetR/AcrR family transcriptional regulator n=1 Tax=Rhodococcus sp. KBS0724 TaxID=1179674 RepID=UPI0021B10ACB|nr:TetR/AcrR family transcriptional regulator [Rhodococcus sp. KBS0724]
MAESKSVGKAWGRDEVRHAVLRAARTKFAAKGMSVTLRELAQDAGVNLGLIHKHLGNKDDIVRAVLVRNSQQSANVVESVESLADAVRRLFLVGVADPDYVRIVTWLILEGRTDLLPADEADGGAILARIDQSSDSADVRIMLGLAAIAGWSLFGSEILNNADDAGSDRVNVELRMADLLAAIVELPEFAPGKVKSP